MFRFGFWDKRREGRQELSRFWEISALELASLASIDSVNLKLEIKDDDEKIIIKRC